MRRTSRGVARGRGPPSPAWARLGRALGVTRVARVSGLDRSGIEVACAVRPGGHVLQVTNGKGLAFRDAAAGAVLEAAELACAERVDPADLRWASARELGARGVAHLAPAELGGTASDEAGARGGARLAWREVRDLCSGEPMLAPAAALHVPAQGGPALGLAGVRWTSNGMGAHPSWLAALLHALLEAVERDQLGRALPDGWTEDAIASRLLRPADLPRSARGVAGLVARLQARQLDAYLFDLAPDGGMGLPVAGALLFDLQGGPVPLTAGYACRLDLAAALEAALLEAAQSRLTDIHGAREDVTAGEPRTDARGVERLGRACRRKRGRPSPLPSGRDDQGYSPSPWTASRTDLGVRTVLARLRRAGHARAAAVDLAPPGLGVHVAKVLVPGLILSELLL